MTFLHPLILGVGLGAIAIPIIVHFLRRRRRPIPWAAMRFLQEAMRKRRKRLRLEQILLLISRCALVALIGLAIARPILGANRGASGPQTLLIVIDDSIGSALTAEGSMGLEASIAQASAELQRLDGMTGDRVGLVTMGSPSQTIIWPPTGEIDAARRALDRIEPTDSGRDLAALREALGSVGDTEDETADQVAPRVAMFSQWRSAAIDELLRGGALPTVERLLIAPPEVEPAQNYGIVSLTASTPSVLDQSDLAPPVRATITLTRSIASGEQDIPVELITRPQGTIAARTTVRFADGSRTAMGSVSVVDPSPAPGRGGRVALEARLPEDANPRDNTARTVLSTRRTLRVGIVERARPPGDSSVAPSVWVSSAASPDERAGVDVFSLDPASLASIPPASVDALFILEPNRVSTPGWNRAREVLDRGGLVVVSPDTGEALANWDADLLTLTDGAIAVGGSRAAEATDAALAPETPDLGVLGEIRAEFAVLSQAVRVRRLLPITPSESATVVLATADDRPVAISASSPEGRGLCVVFAGAFDLNWSDLPARPVFVPIIQELIRRGSGRGIDLSSRAGTGPTRTPGAEQWSFDTDLSGTPAPTTPLGSRSGVALALDRDGSVVRAIAINPHAGAARTDPSNVEQLQGAFEDAFPNAEAEFGEAATELIDSPRRASSGGDRLALLLLAIASIVALFEMGIARIASHPADRAETSRPGGPREPGVA